MKNINERKMEMNEEKELEKALHPRPTVQSSYASATNERDNDKVVGSY